jgi:hypothetical protein
MKQKAEQIFRWLNYRGSCSDPGEATQEFN